MEREKKKGERNRRRRGEGARRVEDIGRGVERENMGRLEGNCTV